MVEKQQEMGTVVSEQRPARVSTDASSTPNPPQPLSHNFMLFALVVLLPVSGAVFAAMSVNQSSIGNAQSQTANQIALLSLCYANSVSRRRWPLFFPTRLGTATRNVRFSVLMMRQSSSFCSELLGRADTIIPELAEKLFHHAPAGQPMTLLDSEGGRSFLLSSIITFWVFLAASVLCTLWYSIETLWRWRRSRQASVAH
ncbi:hypothetical protein LEL_05453 [Akanthomyces lecanii RCEF 1005]|uniref:Uncharacterized protein n=1 Tax=Akanthomyces lecanii RCEF 1005 TaxID=1081108 RepID=A0A168I282_CORDF|nr:hypothetical protein LEL_05453 [Akanthomyces lecanii RCEF 1005]